MEETEDFSDERNKSWCIHCGKWLTDTEVNEDHVPTKSFLLKPWPHHLPTVTICKPCNSSFSLDEQYFVAFLSAVLSGTTDPAMQIFQSAARSLSRVLKLRERIERSKTSYPTTGGETRTVWKPESDRINRVVLKNARGHAYYESGEQVLGDPTHIWTFPLEAMSWRERSEFEDAESDFDVYPEVGSRMLTRMFTGDDLSGQWVVVQNGKYRYTVRQSTGVRVRSVIAEYLATEVQWG
jgi:hypothetical protein